MSDVDKDDTFIFLDPPYYQQMSSGLYGKTVKHILGFHTRSLQSLLSQWSVGGL